MFKVLFLTLLLLVGVVIAPDLAGHQGYVLIETADYRYELSITTLVILFVASLGVVYALEGIISHFLHLSHVSYHWFANRKQNKAQRQTFEGLIALDKGEYKTAQRLIGNNAEHSAQPVLSFIKAAEASQKAGDDFSANHYLHKAREWAEDKDLMVDIARLKILLSQQKWQDAHQSITALLPYASDNKAILTLAVQIYSHCQDYTALVPLLGQIEKMGILTHNVYTDLAKQVEESVMEQQVKRGGKTALLTWWHTQSRSYRQRAMAQLTLIRHLLDNQGEAEAYPFILALISKDTVEDPVFFHAFNQQILRLHTASNTALCQGLEKWLAKKPALKGELGRSLGFLYARRGEFAKASFYFTQALQAHFPLTDYDKMMAMFVFKQNGEQSLADKILRNALYIANATENERDKLPSEAEDKTLPLAPMVGHPPTEG